MTNVVDCNNLLYQAAIGNLQKIRDKRNERKDSKAERLIIVSMGSSSALND